MPSSAPSFNHACDLEQIDVGVSSRFWLVRAFGPWVESLMFGHDQSKGVVGEERSTLYLVKM